MTPQERIALALQYQKQRDLGSVLPSMPDPNAPAVEPKQSFLDRLSEAASGAGYGLGEQVEGLGQMVRHPLNTLRSMAVGAGKAMDDPSAVIQALKQSAGEAVSSPFNMGRAVGANVSPNPRKLAAMLESPMVKEMTVYHGTPHRFPATEANPLGEFDASKIGTGEGAQAYGHGIYVAESPDVAHGYAWNLGQRAGNPAKINGVPVNDVYASIEAKANKMPHETAGLEYQKLDLLERLMGEQATPESVLKIAAEQEGWNPKAIDWFKKEVAPKYQGHGALYTVDLPDEHIERMLDWDKPLSEQSETIQNLARKVGSGKSAGPTKAKLKAFVEGKENPDAGVVARGEDLYRALSDYGGQSVEGSRALQAVGIPGIKYLDAGSRGQGGSGTRNFVIFPGEEKNLKILERK